jgi:hypothetical protein
MKLRMVGKAGMGRKGWLGGYGWENKSIETIRKKKTDVDGYY